MTTSASGEKAPDSSLPSSTMTTRVRDSSLPVNENRSFSPSVPDRSSSKRDSEQVIKSQQDLVSNKQITTVAQYPQVIAVSPPIRPNIVHVGPRRERIHHGPQLDSLNYPIDSSFIKEPEQTLHQLRSLDYGVNEKEHIPQIYVQDTLKSRGASQDVTNLDFPTSSRASSITLTNPQNTESDVDGYTIQRLAEFDDMETMPKWKWIAWRLSPLPVALSFASYWLYFALRFCFVLDTQRKHHTTYWVAWVFISIELLIITPMLLQRIWCLHATGKRKRPKLRLVGDHVPTVDVIITSCKEDDHVIFDTVLAACNLDYPQDRFRVLLSDDGNSQNLRQMVARSQHPNLHYLSRPKYPGVPHHFKAGNLNYTLDVTKSLPGGSGEFFAGLDADMIPTKDWLRGILPHLISDSKCSVACPPQLFYNIPKDDPLCESLDAFFHAVEPVKDTLAAAWCTGSGYVFRRKALDGIGGFPVESLGEDVCTSNMLLGAGWKTAFVHEPLQFGLVPEDLPSHLKQRTRWTIGTIQTALKLNFCLYGSLVRQMTFVQRMCTFVYTTGAIVTVFVNFSLILLPIVLLSGSVMVPFSDYNQLRWLIGSTFLCMILNRINEQSSWLPAGYRKAQREIRMWIWMAPFNAAAIVRTFVLPKWLGGKVAVFTSTGSQSLVVHERDPKRRAPLFWRLKVALWDCRCFIHVFYILLIITAISVSTWRVLATQGNSTTKQKLVGMLTHVGWPPVIWLVHAVACFEPIRYAIWPPSVPDREDLLLRDQKTGVAYPTEEAKKTESGWITWMHEVQYSSVCIYIAVVFVLSFWL